MKVKIKSYNDELPVYLSLDKTYEASLSSGRLYFITADCGDTVYFVLNNCLHLNGGSWEIVEE